MTEADVGAEEDRIPHVEPESESDRTLQVLEVELARFVEDLARVGENRGVGAGPDFLAILGVHEQ